jgi:3-phosphoshikimate 1-carboxyvinyltransferase
MSLKILSPDTPFEGLIQLPSSKSESNRVLIIRELAEKRIKLENLSAARDTQTMLQLLHQKGPSWDVLDAGTTMRFCTAYLALHGHETIITGTERMQQRPIKILVDALKLLGAQIQYQQHEGFPPLKISGLNHQLTNTLSIEGNISSQYISALLMIAPVLPQGLQLELIPPVYSEPYIVMTLSLMQHFGIKYQWTDNRIEIAHQDYQGGHYKVESDWSGASYWYAICSLLPGSKIKLPGLRKHSYQGDQEISRIFQHMGVHTEYDDQGAVLTFISEQVSDASLDFRTCPDLAQTVMVVAAARGINLTMTGLESLKIKETDRIKAMQLELKKVGTDLIEESGRWRLIPGPLQTPKIAIQTYEDHRMAMAFAPLATKIPIEIEDPQVVNKSYPGFWEDMSQAGFKLQF